MKIASWKFSIEDGYVASPHVRLRFGVGRSWTSAPKPFGHAWWDISMWTVKYDNTALVRATVKHQHVPRTSSMIPYTILFSDPNSRTDIVHITTYVKTSPPTEQRNTTLKFSEDNKSRIEIGGRQSYSDQNDILGVSVLLVFLTRFYRVRLAFIFQLSIEREETVINQQEAARNALNHFQRTCRLPNLAWNDYWAADSAQIDRKTHI